MEIHGTPDGLVVKNGRHILQCSFSQKIRATSLYAKEEVGANSCLGQVHGVLGRLTLNPDGQSYLLLISKCSSVGLHPLGQRGIYKVKQICAVPLFFAGATEISDQALTQLQQTFFNFEPCPHHAAVNASNLRRFLQRNDKNLRETSSPRSVETSGDRQEGVEAAETVDSSDNLNILDKSQNFVKSDQKLLDDILKLFNETKSFYFSDVDLTKRFERLKNGQSADVAVDEFFWNKFLLRDLIEQNDEESKFWIKPVIQGFIEQEKLQFDEDENFALSEPAVKSQATCEVMLISRRSINRAGTRYIKRGVDKNGHCANFVETEQILLAAGHTLAFVQLRASIPIFWTQPGYKYRPPPILCKSKEENDAALKSHFDRLRSNYDQSASSIIAVNLIDQAGREKILGDAFLEHVLGNDSEYLVYVAFDFHEHCRGLKFENIEVLVDSMAPELKSMRFSWLDKNGEFICRQNAIFRVNCVDCLDRTNVAQAALARRVLDGQLRKLGFLAPDQQLRHETKLTLQSLWANNGDALSRQYTGTAALKGDFTRTGQRNLAGLVKDGYNSASRYCLSHLRDEQRQVAINAVLGLKVKILKKHDDDREEDDLTIGQKTERLRLFVAYCEKLVVPDDEILLAAWPLVRATFLDQDFLETGQLDDDMDVVVLLTKNSCYVALYDDVLDEFVDFQRIFLQDIKSLEMGHLISSSSNIFKGQKISKVPYLRIGYNLEKSGKKFCTWRSSGIRLFNSLALPVKSVEEHEEYVGSIFDQFLNAFSLSRLESKICSNRFAKLECKRVEGSPKSASPRSTSPRPASKSPHKTVDELSVFNAKNDGLTLRSDCCNSSKDVANVASSPNPTIRADQSATEGDCGLLIDLATSALSSGNVAPSLKKFCSGDQTISGEPTVAQSPDQSLTLDEISLSINAAIAVPSSDHALKTSKSESVLESMIVDCRPTAADPHFGAADPLTLTDSSKDETGDGFQAFKKSRSSSNVKEKLIDGKRFFRSVGRQVKNFSSDGKAKILDLARGGFKEGTAGFSPVEKGVKKCGNFQQYEDRIRKSRTKFILL